MRESAITAHLRARVKALGWRAWKANGTLGDMDWIIQASDKSGLPPAYGHLELKAPGKWPESHQMAEIEDQRLRGAYAGWTDSKNGVDAFLDGLAARRGGSSTHG